MLSVALYQPDIPQNAGALLRLSACLGIKLHIIQPSGFVWSDRRLQRSGLDYAQLAEVVHHASWHAFQASLGEQRLVLLTTRGAVRLDEFRFHRRDLILLGRESAGVPEAVHERADARLRIPMTADARSLNVASSAALVLSRALDQLALWPD